VERPLRSMKRTRRDDAPNGTMCWELVDDGGSPIGSYVDAADAVNALNELPRRNIRQSGVAHVIAFDGADGERLPGAIHRHAPVGDTP
jgi:hypothetical protein